MNKGEFNIARMSNRINYDHVAIGDIHGRNGWMKNIDFLLSKYKKIIFVGDYVDSFNLSNDEILQNLLALIELKKKHPNQVILLLGNHDIHYWLYPNFQGKGFVYNNLTVLNVLFEENKNLFQVAYQIDNILCTHAGVSQTWINMVKENGFDILEQLSEEFSLADILNDMGKSSRHQDSVFTPGGISKAVGPCWLRPSQYLRNPLLGYKQIVGHTYKNGIETYLVDANTSITVIDVLGVSQTYYEF